MRIVALRTYSLSCNPILDPIVRLGHEVIEIVFFSPAAEYPPYSSLPAIIDDHRPDLVVMLGQHDDKRGNCPPAAALAAIARQRPFVHICCDGSERVWWQQLDEYALAAPEMVHVNIDGTRDGFFLEDRPKRNGMGPVTWTTLCPVDHEPWQTPVDLYPWGHRPCRIGFCGGWGEKHPRGPAIENLMKAGYLVAALRPFNRYEDFRSFMVKFRAGYNHAHTGTADHMHVKARVMETAFAGAVLIEPEGSPTANWFEAGHDYLTYNSIHDVERIYIRLADGLGEEEAERMRRKAIDLYSAERFWPRLIELAGL